MRFVVLLLLALGAGGCVKHAIDGVEQMRARACAGDAAGFLNHVDRQEMIRTSRARAEKNVEGSFARLDPSERAAGRAKFQAHVDSAMSTLVNDTLTAWAYDIKQGPTSDLCRLSILESSEVGDAADVHVRSLAAGDRHWKMVRRGDRWLLGSVDD